MVAAQPPVVDINGPLPGSTISIDYLLGGPPVPVASELSIDSTDGMIAMAQVLYYSQPNSPPMFHFDASGTSIQVYDNGSALVLYGLDTAEHYEQVLRSLRVEYLPWQVGYTSTFSISVISYSGLQSVPVNSLVTTLDPTLPSIDLNGVEPGENVQLPVIRNLSGQPLLPDGGPSIESPHSQPIEVALVTFDYSGLMSLSADTTGTNIQVTTLSNGLQLDGQDTVEHYEQVLRSLRIVTMNGNVGSTYRVQFTVANGLGISAPATALLTVVESRPPLVDLDADPAHEYFATSYRPGVGPVPLVDPTGLTIDYALGTLTDAKILLDGGPATLAVDTSGTNITATVAGNFLELHGTDTVANYQQVLRTATFTPSVSAVGPFSATFLVWNGGDPPSPPVESLIAPGNAPEIVGRYLFYANSKFAAQATNDAAIAPDKTPYFAGDGVASPASATSYSLGINGMMVDLSGTHGIISSDDFAFKIGDTNDPGTWAAAPQPSQVLVRPGAGVGGSDRIELVWPDGAIKNTWLQVTVKGDDSAGGYNTHTGLVASDIFYFGNLVGDSFAGTPPMALVTNVNDEIGVRTHYTFQQPVTNIFDFNKDGLVNVNDELIARTNYNLLFRIDLPAPGALPTAVVAVLEQQTTAGDAVDSIRASAADPSGAAVATALALPPASPGTTESRPALPATSNRRSDRDVDVRSVAHASDEMRARARWRSVAAAVAEFADSTPVDDELLSELIDEV